MRHCFLIDCLFQFFAYYYFCLYSKNEAANRTFQPYEPKKLHELNLITPILGHLDDLSPGDAQMNGLKFPATSHNLKNNNSHYSSSLSLSSSLRNQTSNSKPVYPNLAPKPKSSATSSPSWSTKSARQTNGHHNGGVNLSTTAYLLSGKTNNIGLPKSQFQSPHSKSVSNLNSSTSFNNMDLLGSIETDSYQTSNTQGYHFESSLFSNNNNSSSLQNRHSTYFDYSSCIYLFLFFLLRYSLSLVIISLVLFYFFWFCLLSFHTVSTFNPTHSALYVFVFLT